MKTTTTFFRFLACLWALVLLSVAWPALAQDEGQGTPFYLLSDATFGSSDSATVRLEAQKMDKISELGGVDVYVYRVDNPLNFLKAQKNLHRINVEGDYVGDGLANSIARIWDTWWNDSRKAWRSLFSSNARESMTTQAPEVALHPLVKAETPQILNPQYKPLKAHTLVDSFRYPVQVAAPIKPPAGVTLEGSSSNFTPDAPGNVMIPLGKLAPGLYLVEAMAGEHRAVTMVFVSDSIAVTKVSAKQMMVWVADRRDGKPLANAETVWSDGVGVLASANTDGSGLATFNRDTPEKSYVYGQDAQGGVFIAENFYYDSEIYNTKLYAVTDRPLYRPGETVFVKIVGRDFHSARDSTPIASDDIKLQVFDASGFPVAGQTLHVSPQSGGDTSFTLPSNAVAGGYELRFSYKGDSYGAAFRVAEYQKPHFEINVLPEKHDYKTNEDVTGRIQLVYPDGKPVADAKAELTVRAQRLTMVEGDLGYSGQFPVELSTASLTTDSKGFASFKLPAAKEPSRYVLSVLATDGAAYRVRATKEILVERGAGTYSLKSDRTFSSAGESVSFTVGALTDAHALAAAENLSAPVSWDWVRLENRQRENGKLGNGNKFPITFAQPGTYTISLRDANGNIVGATNHYVSGNGIGAPQGSIEMVFDKTEYKPGETASALITFPKPVEQALLTLERDSVEKTSLLAQSGNGDWIHVQRLSPTQWRADLPVGEDYGPNITLSVVYIKDGDYVFQNLGLKVEQPRVDVAVHADKAVYAPGDTVTLDLNTLAGGKPAAGAQLTVSVVDEMVYVLQPEIAPNIFDFFYHPRRNNVRTSASLNFIGYDLAKTPSKLALPAHGQAHERAIKLLERPRREDKDTALWQPNVTTDADGHAKVTFTMPDSLTRWRITVRGMTPAGVVGQSTSYVRSDKDFYVKWTSPNWLREQDKPNASVAIFNQGNKDASVELAVNGGDVKQRTTISVKPGANFVPVPLTTVRGDTDFNLTLSANGKPADALVVPIKVVPLHWQGLHSVSVPLVAQETPLKLPADASDIRLQFADSANAQFRRLMDDLIDYPYGCVEQTSSRIIPYSLALQSVLPNEERLKDQLTQRLYTSRFRLAQMAGPDATFGWWSVPQRDEDVDALLTTYAYYADWYASRALNLGLPPGHFDRLLEVYRKNGVKRSPWHRALMMYWMADMGLPVKSMAEAVLDDITRAPAAGKGARHAQDSEVFTEDDDALQTALGQLLAAYVVQQTKGTVTPAAQATLDNAAQQVSNAQIPLGSALLLMTGRLPVGEAAGVLNKVRSDSATIDRSLTLLWTYRAMSGTANANLLRTTAIQAALAAPWQVRDTATGQHVYGWPAAQHLPTSISLTSAPTAGLTAIAQFTSSEAETSTIPVHLERHLYRMVREDEAKEEAPAAKPDAKGNVTKQEVKTSSITTYKLELVGMDETLKTDEVYVDELVLKHQGRPLHFGIVEVPLPPGANADRSTWGINLDFPNAKETAALELAHYEQTPRGYSVPVDVLDKDVSIHHLVRFAQTGKFKLPPARYYNMYQPADKAFEEKFRANMDIR